MNPPDLELLAQYLANELSASQCQVVQSRLCCEPAFADELIRLSRIEAVIQEWATACHGPVAVFPKPEKLPGRRWIREATAVAAVLVAGFAALLIFVRQAYPPEPATPLVALTASPFLERVDGDAYLVTDAGSIPVHVGQQLNPGDRVETSSDGEVTVRMPDSGMLEIGNDSTVRMLPTTSEAKVFLEHGSVHAAPMEGTERPMVIASPTGSIFGLFAFSVATDRDESKVTADSGPASLTRATDGETMNVPMGQYQTTKANAPPARVMPPSDRRPIRTLAYPAGPVRAMTLSPHGKTLSVVTWDNALEIRDFENDQKVGELRDHDRTIKAMAVSHDGRFLATSSLGRGVRIRDAESGQVQSTLTKHRGEVLAMAFAPYGEWLALARETRRKTSIAIHETRSNSERVILTDADSSVNALAVSPDGRWLAVAFDNGVRVWDTQGWTETVDKIAGDEEVLSVAFSPDSRYLAFGAADGVVKIYDVKQKAISSTFDSPTLSARCVTFSTDGTKVAAAVGRSVWIWDVASGQALKSLAADRRRVNSVLFTPDGESALTIGTEKTLKVWKVN